MDTILTINIVIAVVFTCCYAYQLFFLAVPFTKKQEPHKPEVLHNCCKEFSADYFEIIL